jgi:hypothetical protein
MSDRARLPFDRVVLSTTEGRQYLSVQQFLCLPLHRRVRAMLQHELEFFSGSSPVDQHVALRALMTSRSQQREDSTSGKASR